MLSMTFVLAAALLGCDDDPRLQRALAKFRAGDYPAVLETLKKVSAPDSVARAHYLRAETLWVLGDLTGSAAAFEAVVALRPESVPALEGLGRSWTRLGKSKEAGEVLRRAVELDDEDPAALRSLGEWHLSRGELGPAEEHIAAAVDFDPDDARTARARVRLLLAVEDAPAALEAARDFAAAREKHPMGPFLVGLVQERMEHEEEAIAAYRQALERDPRFLDAHKNLAILGHTLSNTYQIEERNELAFEHYARYFELGGRDEGLRTTYDQLVAAFPQIREFVKQQKDGSGGREERPR